MSIYDRYDYRERRLPSKERRYDKRYPIWTIYPGNWIKSSRELIKKGKPGAVSGATGRFFSAFFFFEGAFHNAPKRLSFFLIKRCFRSHRRPPNAAPTFLSLNRLLRPFHEDKLNGRRWPIDSGSPVARHASQTSSHSHSSYYLRPIRRRERRKLAPTYIVVRPRDSALAVFHPRCLFATFLPRCRPVATARNYR